MFKTLQSDSYRHRLQVCVPGVRLANPSKGLKCTVTAASSAAGVPACWQCRIDCIQYIADVWFWVWNRHHSWCV